jgi:hypothetical protein
VAHVRPAPVNVVEALADITAAGIVGAAAVTSIPRLLRAAARATTPTDKP